MLQGNYATRLPQLPSDCRNVLHGIIGEQSSITRLLLSAHLLVSQLFYAYFSLKVKVIFKIVIKSISYR